MIYWGLLLHIYQPPTQTPEILKKVVKESYRPLVHTLQGYPEARVTLNINGVLTQMLWEHGFHDILDDLLALARRGQIEFTGSAQDHPILPLIPPEEAERQIRLNYETNRHFFDDVYRPLGFFPPEMAFSPELAPLLVASHHRWVVISGVACPTYWPVDRVHEMTVGGEKLGIIFRDDIWSNKIAFRHTDAQEFLGRLAEMERSSGDAYMVTAMDGETFGHHHHSWEEGFLALLFRALAPEDRGRGIRMATLGQIEQRFPRGEAIVPKPSSWSTSAEDIAHGNYYPLWHDKDNPLHHLQWEHLELARQMWLMAQALANTEMGSHYVRTGREVLDTALHSCQFFWASRRPMWDPAMIERGLALQEEVIENALEAVKASGVALDAQRRKELRHLGQTAQTLANRIRRELSETPPRSERD